MKHSLALGAILVAVVLFFLLGSVRTACISLTAIPLSLLTAVIILEKFGITINTITLGGLVIALGEVVDDSIIDVENIFRRLRGTRPWPNPSKVHRPMQPFGMKGGTLASGGSVVTARRVQSRPQRSIFQVCGRLAGSASCGGLCNIALSRSFFCRC